MTQVHPYVLPVLLLLLTVIAGVQVSAYAPAPCGESINAVRSSVVDNTGGSYSLNGVIRSQLANNSFSGAYFTGNPVEGDAPLTVAFMDLSAQTPEAWSWDFGDGGSSTDQNPVHTYTVPGTYSVTLTITRNEKKSGMDLSFMSTITRDGYIYVHGTPPPKVEISPIIGQAIPSLAPRYSPPTQSLSYLPSPVTVMALAPASPLLVPSLSVPFTPLTTRGTVVSQLHEVSPGTAITAPAVTTQSFSFTTAPSLNPHPARL